MKLKTVSRKLAFRRDDRSGPSLVRITVIFGLLLLAFLTVLFNLRGDVLAQSVVYDSVLLGLAKNHASDHKGSNILTTSSTKSSCIKWCDGTNHTGSGRCESANQIISVTSDLQDFRLQLKQAMDARREMTPQGSGSQVPGQEDQWWYFSKQQHLQFLFTLCARLDDMRYGQHGEPPVARVWCL